jgi:hypothetical protein
MTEFETKILTRLLKRMDTLEAKVIELGRGASRAFEMCKEVIETLARHQKEMTENLDEYGGVISQSSWM